MHKTMECYVDSIAIMCQACDDHIANLKEVFNLMQAHRLKMNPTKSYLVVSSEKFLGFLVTSKGIHRDPEKYALSRSYNHLVV